MLGSAPHPRRRTPGPRSHHAPQPAEVIWVPRTPRDWKQGDPPPHPSRPGLENNFSNAARGKAKRQGGVAPVFWAPQRGTEWLGAPRGPGRAGRPGAGGRGRARLLREGPAGGRERPGRGEAGEQGRERAGPPRPKPQARGPPAPAAPSGPAVSPGCCPGLVPRPAVLGGGEEGKEEGAEEGTSGWERRSGREGGGRRRAGGSEGGGEPSQTRPPPAQTLKSRPGARSPAGSDGGGACARPPGPRPSPCPAPPPPAAQTTGPGGRCGGRRHVRHDGSRAVWSRAGPACASSAGPRLPGPCWEL